jgi:hypothetical protein
MESHQGPGQEIPEGYSPVGGRDYKKSQVLSGLHHHYFRMAAERMELFHRTAVDRWQIWRFYSKIGRRERHIHHKRDGESYQNSYQVLESNISKEVNIAF